MAPGSLPDPEQLAARILRGERGAVASGLNLLDNRLADARDRAVRLLACLSGERWRSNGHLIGVTGPPGAGKSFLVSAMIREWRLAGRTVGVLAVDPSSRPELGGGALLGDRIRIKTTGQDEGLFIRSLANRNQLGGVATEVWPMSWLMLVCFDIVVIETVGVGQTEIDIAEIGDTVCYVGPAGLGRHDPVPEVGHHRDPGHLRRQQVRPRCPGAQDGQRDPPLRPAARSPGCLGLPGLPGERDEQQRDRGVRTTTSPAIGSFSPTRACSANCVPGIRPPGSCVC